MAIGKFFYTAVLEAALFSLFGSVTVNSLPASATGACCFLAGGGTCDNHNPKQCPNIPACETPSACTGACSTQSKGTWCPGVTPGPGPAPSPPRNAADTGNVAQPFRPPRRTAVQADAISKIINESQSLSEAARPWVLEYMGSDAVRTHLHPSLQTLSNADLLARFEWEYSRLPIIHNAPVDAANVADLIYMQSIDDTTLNLTLENGFIQNTCQRTVDGASREPAAVGNAYHQMAVTQWGFPSWPTPTKLTTTRANDCMIYNANNLRKTSGGNTVAYGGMTYVLNPKTMRGRRFTEVADGGLLQEFHSKLNFSFPYPLGTVEHWFHLLQPHEAFFNLPYPPEWHIPPTVKCCNYSIADIFNRWWVPDTPPPTSGFLLTNPYFEMMSTTVWLPEDLLYIMVPFANVTRTLGSPGAHIGLWGTTLGTRLREWCRDNHRPLIWVNPSSQNKDSVMLLDPYVDGIAGGRITAADVTLFEEHWSIPRLGQWYQLEKASPPHLHFHYRSWDKKELCAGAEANDTANVIGVDEAGNCVYWSSPPTPDKWERANDGTCEPSTNPGRALWTTKQACQLASQQAGFVCVHTPTPNIRFCSSKPSAPMAFGPPCAKGEASIWSHTTCIEASYTTMETCEQQCYVAAS